MASTNIQTFSGDVTVTSNLTVDTNTFHVDSVAGRIGIGKTDPAFALDVTGTINATSLYVGGSELQAGKWTSDASNIYYTTGAVGIGTNSPAKTLEVQGTLRLSNATTGGVSDLRVTSNNWDGGTILEPTDPTDNDHFGSSVAITGDGTYAIVGAYFKTITATYQGAAYFFTWTGTNWNAGTRITSSTPQYLDYFGANVAITGDGARVMVSAPNDSDLGDRAGTVFIFSRTGTTLSFEAKLVSTTPADYQYFGNKIDISNDGAYAIVGTYAADGSYGAAWIFTRIGTTWSTGLKITSPNPGSGWNFGSSVALSGDGTYAVVGAGYDNYGQGAIYIFKRTGTSWGAGFRITGPGIVSNDQSYFGYSVAISNDGTYVVVGAPYINTYRGAAYIFKRTDSSWDTGTRILPTDTVTNDQFGWSVDISNDGTRVIVAAPFKKSTSGIQTGAAYIFKRTGTTWDTGTKIVAKNATKGTTTTSVATTDDGTRVMVGGYLGISTFKQDLIGLSSNTSIYANGTILSFTGQHMCCPDGPMSQGQIVSANKNKYITLNGPLTTGARAINSSESIPVVCLSNVANDKNVFGVVDHHEQGGTTRLQESGIGKVTQEKELGDNRVIVNSIGEGAMWVTNTNGNLVSGNYITTSNIAGYGQKQHDNKLHSYTVAKITMDCDFEPEDIPIQVIKKDAEGKNVLDTYGRIQWEDTDRTEKAYRIRYLTTEGQRTDQANAVWTAAYVGCTYHCG
jgi:hypothetical protein